MASLLSPQQRDGATRKQLLSPSGKPVLGDSTNRRQKGAGRSTPAKTSTKPKVLSLNVAAVDAETRPARVDSVAQQVTNLMDSMAEVTTASSGNGAAAAAGFSKSVSALRAAIVDEVPCRPMTRPAAKTTLIADRHLLTTNHQPPTANHQPPTTNQ